MTDLIKRLTAQGHGQRKPEPCEYPIEFEAADRIAALERELAEQRRHHENRDDANMRECNALRARVAALEKVLTESCHDWRDTKAWLENSAIGRAARLTLETGAEQCVTCKGTGAIDAATSADDPSCPDCDGEGSTMQLTHTTEDDFQHFLSYMGFRTLPKDQIANLHTAYFHGAWKETPANRPAKETEGNHGQT